MSAVQRILDAYWDGNLPVDPKRIAAFLELDVEESVMAESGAIELRSNGTALITYKLGEPSVRQRFTIAHEIGHFVLGHLNGAQKKWRDPVANFSSNATRKEERDANDFAAQLLMPATTIEFAVKVRGMGPEALARAFEVSQVAMGYRLSNLGLANA